MSNRPKVVHGLNRPAFKKETVMGVAPITEFLHNGTTKVIPIEQTTDAPFNPLDTTNQEMIRVTTGSHIQPKTTVRNGRRDTTLDVTTPINKNDFLTLAYRYFQVYGYTGPLFAIAVSDITNSSTRSTLTVDTVANITVGMELVISGRADSTEDSSNSKTYTIKAINGLTITIDGLLSEADLTGDFETAIGIHSLKIQPDDCNKTINMTSSLWLPNDFPNSNNTCGSDGELITGLGPLALNLDLIAATAQLTMRGKYFNEGYTDQPIYTTDTNTTDYLEVVGNKEGYSSTENGVMEYYNGSEWLELDTEALTCNIVMGMNEDAKNFRGNRFSRVVVDGVSVDGSYSAVVLDVDDENNISNSIISKRSSTENTIKGRVKLINEDGTGFYIEGTILFMNPTVPTKAIGGFTFSVDYMFVTSEDYSNIEMTVYNNYTEDLINYL